MNLNTASVNFGTHSIQLRSFTSQSGAIHLDPVLVSFAGYVYRMYTLQYTSVYCIHYNAVQFSAGSGNLHLRK